MGNHIRLSFDKLNLKVWIQQMELKTTFYKFVGTKIKLLKKGLKQRYNYKIKIIFKSYYLMQPS
jgi:hypothetical protein